MAAENMIVVTFEEPSKAYQALSVLKHQGLERKIKLHSAAVVERTAEGAYAIKESETPRAGSTTSTGGLIGAVVASLAVLSASCSDGERVRWPGPRSKRTTRFQASPP